MFEGSTYCNMPTSKRKNITLGLKIKTAEYKNQIIWGIPPAV
jgi:hypothetical protein